MGNNIKKLKKEEIQKYYDIQEKLGTGSFAVVKRATRKSDGKQFAIKVIKKSKLNSEELAVVHDEVEIMHKVNHSNCVQLFEMFETSKKMYMVLELLTGGELFDRIVKKGSYSEKEASDVIKSVVSALQYLHDNGIVHRDLKPENLIYLSAADDSAIKITDFGLAKYRSGVGAKSEEVTMNTACLAVGTEVALAEDFGVQPPCKFAKFAKVEQLGVGSVLVGTGDPVSVLSISPIQYSPEMYEITHSDGMSYVVTPDHLVTLRWIAGPYTDTQKPTAEESMSSISMRWWMWDGIQLTKGHLPLARDTKEQLRSAMWEEFYIEAAKPNSDASKALRTGDLIEVKASVLATDDVWKAMIAEYRATSARVTIARDEPADEATPEVVADALEALPAEEVQPCYEEMSARVHAAGVKVDNITMTAVGEKDYRPVKVGDVVRLVVVLDNPLSGAADPTKNALGVQCTTFNNLETVFKRVHIPIEEDSGIVITATNPIASETNGLDSREAISDEVCRAQVDMVLTALHASTVIVCGKYARARWEQVAKSPGVSKVVCAVTGEGHPFMKFEHTYEDDEGEAEFKVREVTVWFVGHPSRYENIDKIALVVSAALGLPVPSFESGGVGLTSIHKIEKRTGFVRFTVSGDNRFALKDGTITHNCGTPGYVAPEVLKNEPYGKAVDLWSLGVILYILLCGFPPFYHESTAALYKQIKKGDFDFPAPYWTNISDSAKDLVRKLLTVDPAARYTAKQVLEHPWISGTTASAKPLGNDYSKRLMMLQARRRLKKGVQMIIAINKFSAMLEAMKNEQ